jgi:hypothetical protein
MWQCVGISLCSLEVKLLQALFLPSKMYRICFADPVRIGRRIANFACLDLVYALPARAIILVKQGRCNISGGREY